MSIYAEKSSMSGAKSEKFRKFLEFDLPLVGAEAGMQLTLTALAHRIEDDRIEVESGVMSVLKMISVQTAQRLHDSLQSFAHIEKHPCSRGNRVIAADELFPHFSAMLTAAPGTVDLREMLPLLRLLHQCR
jgi:hypothetical protein